MELSRMMISKVEAEGIMRRDFGWAAFRGWRIVNAAMKYSRMVIPEVEVRNHAP
ncbi:hypothetical protein ACFU5B_13160 [Streptomyces murinus]|uniref:hypothetical protein n=1 Tax=Streptomyces murinus TaxID=33900 RepID=UPI0036272F32